MLARNSKTAMALLAGMLLTACPAKQIEPLAAPAPAPAPAGAAAQSTKTQPVTAPILVKRAIARSNFSNAPKSLTVEQGEIPAQPTKVLHRASAERLFGNSGLTLQWISWEKRGSVWIAIDNEGVWWLSGEQRGDDNSGLKLEGHITEIGEDYFLFQGEVTIIGAPDAGRMCDANKKWRFAVTQDRKYWRLREFEWCDDLTDYVDIYF